MDPHTHFLHYLKRVYDPTVGRWLTPDPAGFVDGPNLYAYVHNNPLKYYDPDGLTAWEFAKGTAVGFFPSYMKSTAVCSGLGLAYSVNPVFGAVCTVGVAGYYGYQAVNNNWNSLSTFGRTVKQDGVTAGYNLIKEGVNNKYHKFMALPHYEQGITFGGAAGGITGGYSGLKLGTYAGSKAPWAKNVLAEPKSFVPKQLDVLNGRGDRISGLSPAGSKRSPLEYAPFQKARNTPTTICDRRYTGHALDRMQDRGLMPSVIENTINRGRMKPDRLEGRIQCYDQINSVKVVLDKKSGRVVTVRLGGP